MLRITIFFLALFLLSFITSGKIFASEYFDTSYYVTYDVTESGNTKGTIDVTLTNKTSDYYAASYKVQAGFSDIKNVTAQDPGGKLTPKVTETQDGTIIEAEFNEKAVGIGNSLKYTITFDTPDIAKKYGSLWEVNIPGISDPEAFDQFTVEVNVPKAFGSPVYIKPEVGNGDTVFSKDELDTSAISISYGREQVYKFDLTYHLQNTNLLPVKTEIALPPTTNYQEVYISQIAPKPDNVILDKDGNWLAQYSLAPGEKTDIKASGHVLVSLTPKRQPMSKEELTRYLEEDTYWEVSDPKISRLARELKTPESIYNYLVSNLSYDFSRLEENKPRLGGLKTLQNPDSAVCLEFTDLFITLARAAGIPAREVDGYAQTDNKRQRPLSLKEDILHAWPEYYDYTRETWIMVDPTWGNTTGGSDYFHTFDFDHIVFVIKGTDSEYPVPAGAYKNAGDKVTKDITVSFDPGFKKLENTLSYSANPKNPYYSELPISAMLSVRNTSSGISPETEAEVFVDKLSPGVQKFTIAAIPPYGLLDIPLEFAKTPLLTNETFDFTIRIAGVTQSAQIKVMPLFMSWYAAVLGGIILGILAIIIFAITRRSRGLPVSEQK